jgi:hypothetical protein
MNGHFGCHLFCSPYENVSELDDAPANLLVNIRSAAAAFVRQKLAGESEKENHRSQCDRHQKFPESFILANFPILSKNLDHSVEVAFLSLLGPFGH